jgi:hypothetical protein
MDIVGSDNADVGQFTSGSGTIVYQSVNALFPLAQLPSGFTEVTTGETANVAYDAMDDGSGTQLTQGWSVQT